MLGDELIQFGSAVPLGARRWRIGRLWRGRRGTGAAIGGQVAGDRFVLIEADALVTVDLPLATLGRTAQVLASGVGDAAGPATAAAPIRGRWVLPPAPVHLSVEAGAGGDLPVRWIRRSRAGWRWIDGVDAPLVEERELYRVTVEPAAGAARTATTDSPVAIVTAAERGTGPVLVTVRQIGSNGESPAAAITLPAA